MWTQVQQLKLTIKQVKPHNIKSMRDNVDEHLSIGLICHGVKNDGKADV